MAIPPRDVCHPCLKKIADDIDARGFEAAAAFIAAVERFA